MYLQYYSTVQYSHNQCVIVLIYGTHNMLYENNKINTTGVVSADQAQKYCTLFLICFLYPNSTLSYFF